MRPPPHREYNLIFSAAQLVGTTADILEDIQKLYPNEEDFTQLTVVSILECHKFRQTLLDLLTYMRGQLE